MAFIIFTCQVFCITSYFIVTYDYRTIKTKFFLIFMQDSGSTSLLYIPGWCKNHLLHFLPVRCCILSLYLRHWLFSPQPGTGSVPGFSLQPGTGSGSGTTSGFAWSMAWNRQSTTTNCHSSWRDLCKIRFQSRGRCQARMGTMESGAWCSSWIIEREHCSLFFIHFLPYYSIIETQVHIF